MYGTPTCQCARDGPQSLIAPKVHSSLNSFFSMFLAILFGKTKISFVQPSLRTSFRNTEVASHSDGGGGTRSRTRRVSDLHRGRFLYAAGASNCVLACVKFYFVNPLANPASSGAQICLIRRFSHIVWPGLGQGLGASCHRKMTTLSLLHKWSL